MRLIVDTNILIAALIRNSTSRRLLFLPYFKLFAPETAIDELNKYTELISKKSELSSYDVSLLKFYLFSYIRFVPLSDIMHKMEEAEDLIGDIDYKDVQFLALALAIENDGVWAEDKHFTQQSKIKVWSTDDLLKQMKD